MKGKIISLLGEAFGTAVSFIDDYTMEVNNAPDILTEGSYAITEYNSPGKFQIYEVVKISPDENGGQEQYLHVSYWNPENPAYIMDTFFGWEMP